jgi:acyl-CoA synthetase (AMP-forming)/AMP-acid ligase II
VRNENSSVTLMDYSMSYSTPVDRTAAVVAALAELGVRPEERVLIMLPDGPGFAEAFARPTPSPGGAASGMTGHEYCCGWA